MITLRVGKPLIYYNIQSSNTKNESVEISNAKNKNLSIPITVIVQ